MTWLITGHTNLVWAQIAPTPIPNTLTIRYNGLASGSRTFPPGCTVLIEAYGGGGGGGGAYGGLIYGSYAAGGGGGGYIYIKKFFSDESSFTLTAGMAGVGFADNINGVQGTPSFITGPGSLDIQANQGTGGLAQSNGSAPSSHGGDYAFNNVGTTGTLINYGGDKGEDGRGGLSGSDPGGFGGMAGGPQGGAGGHAYNGSNGSNGSSPGGGGGGARSAALGQSHAGGDGAPGAVIFTVEYPLTPTISASSTAMCNGKTITLSVNNPLDDKYVTYHWFKDNLQVGTGITFNATQPGVYSMKPAYKMIGTGNPVISPALTPDNTFLAESSNEITLSEPVIDVNNITMTVCSGEYFNFTPVNGIHGNIPSGIVYSYVLVSSTGGVSFPSGGKTASFDFGTLVNNTNTVQSAVYDVAPYFDDCSGNQFQFTVSVKPLSHINNIQYGACNGENITVSPVNGTDGTILNGTTYTWTQSGNTGVDGVPATGSGSTIALGTLKNTSSTEKTVTYTVIPITDGCQGDSFELTVTISPSLEVLLISDDHTYCVGDSVLLTANVTPAGNYTYDWYCDNVLVAADGGNTHVSKGLPVRTTSYNYYVIVRYPSGCGDSRSNDVAITVGDPQTVVVTLNYTDICENGTLRATANIAKPDDYSYKWFLDNVESGYGRQFTATGMAVGVHSLYVETTPLAPCVGCEITSTPVAFTVHLDPVVTIAADNATIFAGNAAVLKISAITLDVPVNHESHYTLQWALNGTIITGATQDFYSQVLSTPGTYNFTLRMIATDDVACTSEWSAPATVTVSDSQTLMVSLNYTDICESGTLRATANIASPDNYSYKWYLNNTEIGSGRQFSVSNLKVGKYTLYAEAAPVVPCPGCEKKSATVSFTVHPNPVVKTTADDTVICAKTAAVVNITKITLDTAVNNKNNYTIQWAINGIVVAGALQETISQMLTEVGNHTFTARLLATNDIGCASDWSNVATVTVKPAPIVLLISNTNSCYAGDSIRLTANVTPSGNYRYDWYLDNVLIKANGSNTYMSSGLAPRATPYTYKVIARTTSGGCDGISNECTVTVKSSNTVTITADKTLLCGSGMVTLTATSFSTNASIPNDDKRITYQWAVNGTIISDAVQRTYSRMLEAGIYVFTVRITQNDEIETISEWSDPVIVTVTDIVVPALFVSGCNDTHTDNYRTVHVPITIHSGNPQTYTVSFADLARFSYNHSGIVARNWDGSFSIEARLPNQGGDYPLLIEIDGCLYQSTGRVMLDANADGAKLIEQRWNDILTVNNNPETNGGYTFYAFQWYKNDILISGATQQYYTEKDGKLNGSYHVELQGYAISSSGDAITVSLASCPFTPLPQLRMAVYPVPVKLNQSFTFDTSLSNDELVEATLEIYDAMGQLQRKISNLSPQMTVAGFASQGFYFGRLITKHNGVTNFKFLVQ